MSRITVTSVTSDYTVTTQSSSCIRCSSQQSEGVGVFLFLCVCEGLAELFHAENSVTEMSLVPT